MSLNNGQILRLNAPPSKSDLIRRIAAACLFAPAVLHDATPLSADSRAAIEMAEALGASVQIRGGSIILSPPPLQKRNEHIKLNAGESALALNFFAVIASFYAAEYSIALNGTLAGRKFDSGDVLRRFGISWERRDDSIEFSGAFIPADYTFEFEESNQLISAIAYGVAASRVSCRLSHPKLASAGYLQLTCEALLSHGINIGSSGSDTYIHSERVLVRSIPAVSIEGDWSGAAFFLAAGAFYKPVIISGIKAASYQPDRAILEILRMAGANAYVERDEVCVRPAESLHGFQVDLSGSPDLFPPAAALALNCDGISKLTGIRRLKNKESDRASALLEELSKLGGRFEISGDDLIIQGGGELKGAYINARGDHRIAMASLIAGLQAEGNVMLDDPKCIDKSYPSFLHDFSTLLSFD